MSTDFQNDPEFNDVVPKKSSSRRRNTLIEVLAVVAIIAVLIALLLPATRSARGAARRAQCTNNLKQIGLALHNYVSANNTLPPAYTVDDQGRPLHSWRTLILPYLEQEPLYRTIDLTKPWNDPANAKALATALLVYQCPESAGPPNTTTYLAIVGPNDCFLPREPRSRAEIRDGTASTLMVIEAGEEDAVPWMAPVDADESLVMRLGPTTKLHHPGGTNAGFVDGSVRFLKTSIRPEVRRALMSISGNDTPASDEW
jgi:prepilin-type processing-associated H-X9-DG protein